ncbi:stigma-specific STIG1-like protein 1 [Nicotiana tabacum]|uniref:Stigma-specific STIG1-like protein 1 n=1 Tax=Nicotiana tabacum TaxID=4097 RepID=A0A1S4AQL6_TOBAC|nr:stigma-specific STIG1-like protein 2 [Nicotiana tomentosiformis]XP_016478793.1 PREDICTED: stigma-specific STIG1-like protein 2 [Nicotiana tabacum]
MKFFKLMVVIAVTMALTISLLTMQRMDKSTNPKNSGFHEDGKQLSATPAEVPQLKRRTSRFLAEKERNPRAADHCHKDNEICHVLEGRNSTCCNNKCMDLGYDDHHCGACKRKCRFTETCCRGECVNLSFDKRHCGYCNSRCMPGGYCFYGMCDYA